MFKRLRAWLMRRLSNETVVQAYVGAGGAFGDAVSYLYMGECIGFEALLSRWERWEAEYARRGYRTVNLHLFVDYGGYGNPIPGLRVLREAGEEPILHAVEYREHYLGKVKPRINISSLMGRA